MRPLVRIALAGAVSSLAFAPTALGANSLSAKVSPNKGGSLTVAAPTTFSIKALTPDRRPTTDGSQRIKAVVAKLPPSLLFNTIPFKECKTTSFQATLKCPSSTRLGTAEIIADGGPDVGDIKVSTTLYFGTGFSILARVQSSSPAVIDEAIIGDLRSSGATGYGLSMYIPMSPVLQQPLPGLFPTIKSIDAKVKPMTKSTRVPGSRKKVRLPIAGLGPCTGNRKLPFAMDVVYTNGSGVQEIGTDSASGSAKCRR